MNTKKTLLAAAIALGLGISGSAFADQGGEGSPNTNADDGSAATTSYSGNADSGNDNSTDSSDNSNNSDNSDNSDNSTDVTDAFKIANSGNTDASDSSDNSDNSTSATDAYNTDNSDSSDNSATTLNLSLEVFMNDAELNGSVSGTTVAYGSAGGDGAYVDTRTANEISGGSANFTGVGAIAQNAGVGSVTQANVSVMSNLSAGAN
jgi:hypothetical protein